MRPPKTLDTGPLLAAMEAYIERERRNGYYKYRPNGVIGGWEGLALAAGVSSRSLRRIHSGESHRVQLETADKLAVALDIPLALLYPPKSPAP